MSMTGKYVLMCDIDFSKIEGWGNKTAQSGFVLDGNGYAIKNLVINSSTNSGMHGLFDDITSGATVKNLNMENVSIETSLPNVGALCGGTNDNTRGIIENCTVSGSVKGGEKAGGLIGALFKGKIISCSSSATVTGGSKTGGLVAESNNGKIENCSATGDVSGINNVGGLTGYCSGTIDKSYATGNVTGSSTNVGGLVGYNYLATISNSYATGDVKGRDYVGGAIGRNDEVISNTYSTGAVTGTGSRVGNFVGDAAGYSSSNKITNCYSTNDGNFYGTNSKKGALSGCHGTTDQTGVTGHEPEWFNDGNNLTFLGSAFNTNVIPPDLVDNPRPVPPPPPPPPPTEDGIQFQIGANSGEENTLKIDTSFSLNGFDADVTTREDALETVDKVDALIGEFSTMRSALGASQNRLESVMDSLTTKNNNLSASHSTIVDTDFALESANLVKAQILQNATAALLAQANNAPSIALRLLE